MNPKSNKTELLLKFILTSASKEEWPDNELGVIHLIKYVYLVDLEYALRNNGKTFTGLSWKFHHYGPWSTTLWKQVEPTLQKVGANKKVIHSSKYDDDLTRWSLGDARLHDEIEAELPLSVIGVINRYVHKYGADTDRLLDCVYKTVPMLIAAPNELVTFKSVGMK